MAENAGTRRFADDWKHRTDWESFREHNWEEVVEVRAARGREWTNIVERRSMSVSKHRMEVLLAGCSSLKLRAQFAEVLRVSLSSRGRGERQVKVN